VDGESRTGGSSRAERVAQNESTFRDANEQLAETFERVGVDQRYPFLCECAQLDCTRVIELTLEEYAEVREHPERFLTMVGHEDPESEIVVDNEGRYQVVQKRGVAAETARRLAHR
jgi:hypothetical protein